MVSTSRTAFPRVIVLTVALLAIGFTALSSEVGIETSSEGPSEAEILRDTSPEDLFALRLVVPDPDFLQTQVEVIVQAYNPYTYDPIVDLPVTLGIMLEEDDGRVAEPSNHLLRTGPDGTATLSIPLLPSMDEVDIELEASATYRGYTRQVESDIYAYGLTPRALLSTDRKLYQPGQTVHVRGLWRDSSRRPMANVPVKLTILDDRDRQVAQVELTTSDLGVASFNWLIPSSARPTDYEILAEPDADYAFGATFSVRPYEPSTLWLEATPRQFLLLPGDEAVVDVEARYTNGDPLADAEVELLYTPKSWWIHQESEATSEEEAPDERPVFRTDSEGRVTARLDLAAAFEDVPPSWRSQDLPFRVAVRDPVTLRSESVRFELRLSHQQVHIYTVGSLGDELPDEAFVLAQWANGEPFQGVISVEEAYFRHPGPVLGQVQTDAHGIATISHLDLDEYLHYRLRAYSEDAPDMSLGDSRSEWSIQEDLRLTVPRPLIRTGDALVVDLHVAQPLSQVDVRVVGAEGQILARKTLAHVESSTKVVFPYQQSFQGIVSVIAVDLSPDLADSYSTPAARQQVVYSRANEERLRLDVSTRQDTYRPGETAQLELALQAARGNTSVAVAMVDRATEARQASFDLGDGAALLAPLEDPSVRVDPYAVQIGGWSLHRLLDLPEAERYDDDAQQIARALFSDDYMDSLDSEIHNPLEDQRSVLESLIQDDKDVAAALSRLKRKKPQHVIDPRTFDQALYELGINLDTLRDPWGRPYRIHHGIHSNHRSFQVMSDGRDGEAGTLDDFVVWSTSWPFAHRLGQALQDFAKKRPAEAHGILSDPALRHAAMAQQGIIWEDELDPWGKPYDLVWSFHRNRLHYRLVSRGPDGVWQTQDLATDEKDDVDSPRDDVTVWSFGYSYVVYQEGELRATLQDPFWDGRFPSTETRFREDLQHQGIDADDWKDPWGHPMYFTFETSNDFIDAWTVDDAGRKTLMPREQTFDTVRLWSVGEDGVRSTDDDLKLTHVQRPRAGYQDYLKQLGYILPDPSSPSLTGDEGLLAGVVIMADGFPVPGALVSVIDHEARHVATDEGGSFQFNLPPGPYDVVSELEGFAPVQLSAWVLPGQQFHVVIRMEVEAVYESIIVTGETKTVNVSVGAEPPKTSPPRSTPRLRKDFPETLFWLADGRFDDEGRLRLDIPLADNLTRWHVAALASDAEGRLASAELDVTVTQPFFLLPDLPPRLTAGDVLQLPVDIHNRTGREVSIELELADVTSTGDPEADSTNRLRAQSLTTREGIRRVTTEQPFDQVGTRHLRWTATPSDETEAPVGSEAGEASDAVQKSTEVTWRGAQHTTTQSQLLHSDVEMTVTVPQGSLPGSGELEVLIYDDLESHVVKTLQGMAKKPRGCAEQTTSNAWIHVLLLNRLIDSDRGSIDLAETSRRHATDALASLSAFQSGGGFGYWGGRKPNLALTAYVLEFLLAASESLPVDAQLIDSAATYLEEQAADGRWPQKKKTWLRPDAAHLLHLRTEALVARALAQHGIQTDDAASLNVALLALSRLHGEIGNDPYGLALLTHTASTLLDDSAVEHHGAEEAVLAIALDAGQRLLALTQAAEGHLAWHLRANTPFNGWGRSGRLATTAMALQALASLQATGRVQEGDPLAKPLQAALGGGLSYLLVNKEADGTWFTTQASVQSLRALDVVLDGDSPQASASGADPTLNGQPMTEDASRATFGGPKRWAQPISEGFHQLAMPTVDSEDGGWRLVQTRVTSHLPWDDPRATPKSEDLAFNVQCSDTAGPLQRGETATCDVEIARVGYRGSGMLIAEIGLPPGAEVDEAALQEARQNRHIDDFEVWPGRVVLYIWPGYRNPTIHLTIPWRPRLALKAATQPSVLYDYYNPDARVVLPPRDVVVKGD